MNFKQTRSSTLKIGEPGISAIFDQLVKEEGEYYIYVQEEQGFLNLEDTEDSTQNSAKATASVRDPNELVCEGTRERTARQTRINGLKIIHDFAWNQDNRDLM